MNIHYISNIIEDKNKYYVACESGEMNGQFLALLKDDGSTIWFIPGKSFLNIIFDGYLYLIFADNEKQYYLLKVQRDTGKTNWYHMINQDLYEYNFTKKIIHLLYSSGRRESLSTKTGRLFQQSNCRC